MADRDRGDNQHASVIRAACGRPSAVFGSGKNVLNIESEGNGFTLPRCNVCARRGPLRETVMRADEPTQFLFTSFFTTRCRSDWLVPCVSRFASRTTAHPAPFTVA